MVEKREYKLIALIAAIIIYLSILITITGVLFDKHEKKDYGYNVEDAVVVEIDQLLEKQKPAPKPKEKPQEEIKPREIQKPAPEEPKPEIVQVAEPEPKKEEPKEEEVKDSRDKEAKSAKDLFSTVRTDAYKKAIEEKRKQEAARASRLKKRKAEEARKRAEKMRKARAKKRRAQKLVEELRVSKASSHKKSGEEHDFWSPVANKIMAKWNRTISTQDGLKADVRIRIDNRGRLSYRILKLSNNDLFNTKLKVFLDNLEYERFPAYKEGSYIEATFEFADKER
ncbi:MAG: hypothetical protein B6D59_01995 [Campylobacteraceae bacterium 4484_4]|nr:MAG: hypothetical protein B6D59_01995 [Campylobacteraceae bacterium 4484_4]